MLRLKQLLARADTHCADESGFLEKVSIMARDGAKKLQVMSDFDMTLTRFQVNGKSGYTSHGIIENSCLLPKEYRQKAKALKDKYYPIEVSHNLTREDKIKSMVEWWHSAHELLLEYKIRQDQLREMVKDTNVALREGYEELFSMLDHHNIPITIFSAGLHDTIQCVLDNHDAHRPNVTVFSNKMVFDDDGVLTGFSEPVVHSYNKGTAAVSMEDMKKSHTNVIVLGDSTGDPAMVAGMEKEAITTIKIGYLNYKEEDLMQTYLELYDIVLTGDKGLEFPCATIQAILQHSLCLH